MHAVAALGLHHLLDVAVTLGLEKLVDPAAVLVSLTQVGEQPFGPGGRAR